MDHQPPLFVILAGGQGKNFAPLVTNKTIFPFMDKPLLLHQLEQLDRVGVKKVLIATNSENESIIDGFKINDLEIKTHLQDKPLGMANAILQLEDEIGSQPIVIMNAVDVVADELFINLITEIETKKPHGLITGIKIDKYFPGGYLQLDRNRVTAVIEKPAPGEEPSDLVNLVFHYFSNPNNLFNILKKFDNQDDGYEQALTELVAKNEFNLNSYQNYWHKLKYPHFVLDIMNLFLENRLESKIDPTAQISPQAVIDGAVIVDKNVKIEAGAVIKGPAYIGPNSIIGNHSLVRQSMIERNVIVGFGSEVARSYIGPECKLHHNFIGDSVLEARVNPSFGTITANWRLDNQPVKLKTPQQTIPTQKEKLGVILAQDVFCGINCSFMPGVTVGEQTKIFPGSVINRPLPAKTNFKSSRE